MSRKVIEALLKEQAKALTTAQWCHSQITRLIKEQSQDQGMHQYAEHQSTEQPLGQSKRQKQDTTPSPAEHSDEDLIQGLQAYERCRAQPQHSTSKHQPQAQPTAQSQMAPHNAMHDQRQDRVGRLHDSAAAQDMEAAPALPVAGLRAFHFCPAMQHDGSGKCLMLQPYPHTPHTHRRCGHGQDGQEVLVEFWLAGVQHFCVTTVPSAASYQGTAQQLGASAHLTKHIESRLAQTTASSTAKRCTMHAANFEVIVGRNYYWSLSSEAALQAIAQLTWDEIVLAHSSAQ